MGRTGNQLRDMSKPNDSIKANLLYPPTHTYSCPPHRQMRNQLTSGTGPVPVSGSVAVALHGKQQLAGSGKLLRRQCQTSVLRPSSSAAATHPSQQHRAVAEEARAASACSQLLNGDKRPASPPQPQKQCRICRKLILAQEPSHLCSACRQFVCDDCASYSSSHQVSTFSST